MRLSKQEKREKVLAHLKAFTSEERAQISARLQENLFSSPLWKEAKVVGLYLSMAVEWDTFGIMKQAFEEGKRVAIPKTFPKTKEMVFYELTTLTETVAGPYGIREPNPAIAEEMPKDSMDLLLVPGVAFSTDGYRIGFGGGYYDRYLVDFIHPTLSILHSSQLVEELPLDTYDLPVHYLLTDEGFYL